MGNGPRAKSSGSDPIDRSKGRRCEPPDGGVRGPGRTIVEEALSRRPLRPVGANSPRIVPLRCLKQPSLANDVAMTLVLDAKHPVRPLVQRARSHSSAVMRHLETRSNRDSRSKALSKELVQAHACFVDLLAADYQTEQVQPLVDSTKAVMDAMVTADRAAFGSASERMRLWLIAWGDRNGWNSQG